MAWKYAMIIEILSNLSSHYKFKKYLENEGLAGLAEDWGKPHEDISQKLRRFLKNHLDLNSPPESRIADFSEVVATRELLGHLSSALSGAHLRVVLLVDRLDEGYMPDELGVALVDGFCQAVIDLNSTHDENIAAYVFLRDNIFRAIAQKSPDFTRNIEGQVLRLAWPEYNLFNLVCNRLRVAFDDPTEKSLKVWNARTSHDLSGMEGFRRALRQTLYRPRDILSLLNEAFLNASRKNSDRLVMDDIADSARSISCHRLTDLHKEYESVFPALQVITESFTGSPANLSFTDAERIISSVLAKGTHEPKVQQDLAFFRDAADVLNRLYHVGFLGIRDEKSSAYVFCHDGNTTPKDLGARAWLLIHPCYWKALANIETNDDQCLDDIHDEYEIEVTSYSQEERSARIGRLESELADIELGADHASQFESWCFEVIKIVSAGSLINVELHPNTNALQRRDIVATNIEGGKFWKRILDDYGTRQVVFEIKNFPELGADEYRQVNSYLSNEYGRLGFVITRDDQPHPNQRELNWIKELYSRNPKIIVIKLTAKFLLRLLRKLRNPQKYNLPDKELSNLLDKYIRDYVTIKAR